MADQVTSLLKQGPNECNILLGGLKGAGKTLMLYSSVLDEGWYEIYKNNEKNR